MHLLKACFPRHHSKSMLILLVKACFVVLCITSCTYPKVSQSELDQRMNEVDSMVKYCQDHANHANIKVEDETFTKCVQEYKP